MHKATPTRFSELVTGPLSIKLVLDTHKFNVLILLDSLPWLGVLAGPNNFWSGRETIEIPGSASHGSSHDYVDGNGLNGKPTSENTFAFAGDVLGDHDVCLCE